MIGYKVDIDTTCIDHYQSDEDYGDWHSEYSNSFRSIRRTTKEDNHPDLTSKLDIQDGSPVFVVWVEYSTGDSFGSSTRGSTEAIGVFRDRASAEELAAALRKTADRDTDVDYSSSFSVTTTDGQTINVEYMPWLGYFERLENVYVDPAFMGKNTGRDWPW